MNSHIMYESLFCSSDGRPGFLQTLERKSAWRLNVIKLSGLYENGMKGSQNVQYMLYRILCILLLCVLLEC